MALTEPRLAQIEPHLALPEPRMTLSGQPVFSFYSDDPRKRTSEQLWLDSQLGTVCCCFSNFHCEDAFSVEDWGAFEPLPSLRSASLNCGEAFFQFSKVSMEVDLAFCLSALYPLGPKMYTLFCRGKLPLSADFRRHFEALGVPLVEADDVGPALEKLEKNFPDYVPDRSEGGGYWLRKPPIVVGWFDTDLPFHVMQKIVAAKLRHQPETHYTFELLVRAGFVNVCESTRNDSQWGDGGDGSGWNWLGRIWSELLGEATKRAPAHSDFGLRVPASTYLSYAHPGAGAWRWRPPSPPPAAKSPDGLAMRR